MRWQAGTAPLLPWPAGPGTLEKTQEGPGVEQRDAFLFSGNCPSPEHWMEDPSSSPGYTRLSEDTVWHV